MCIRDSTEPMTLYKLMNLYMLKQVNFPLTNAQLTNFFTEHEYTTYFTLQQALNELEDAGLVHKEASHNSTRYDITREGEETLNFFGKNISSAIIEDMDQYLKENKFRLREEVGTTADFYKGTNQDYIVHCAVSYTHLQTRCGYILASVVPNHIISFPHIILAD